MRKVFINPPDLSNWEQTFSQIVVVLGGAIGTVYIAGQVSVDKEKNLIGGGDLSAQAIQAFQNLESALRAVGAAPSKITILKHRRFCKIPCESSAA